jgi:hypothetical protein
VIGARRVEPGLDVRREFGCRSECRTEFLAEIKDLQKGPEVVLAIQAMEVKEEA